MSPLPLLFVLLLFALVLFLAARLLLVVLASSSSVFLLLGSPRNSPSLVRESEIVSTSPGAEAEICIADELRSEVSPTTCGCSIDGIAEAKGSEKRMSGCVEVTGTDCVCALFVAVEDADDMTGEAIGTGI